ncbi:MAG: helix-turn-helix transcriptional regulator [Bacteroidia bacterium]|nr:helix-turn-helix transcriptional regulator [Bacteroidia bacterium]
MFMANVMKKTSDQDVPEIQPMGSNTLDSFAEKQGLSVTEKAILELLITGLSNAEIADKRHVSENTVKTHLSNIYSKTGVGSRAKLISLLRA